MFAFINRLSAAANELSKAITTASGALADAQIAPQDVAKITDGLASLERRVIELELELGKRMAESEALLLEAKNDRRTARNAEERTRRMVAQSPRGHEGGGELLEGDDGGAAPTGDGGSYDDAQGSGAEGVLTVPARVASQPSRAQMKHNALLRKYAG